MFDKYHGYQGTCLQCGTRSGSCTMEEGMALLVFVAAHIPDDVLLGNSTPEGRSADSRGEHARLRGRD